MVDKKIDAMLVLNEYYLHWNVELRPLEAIVFAREAKDDALLEVIININNMMPKNDYGEGNSNTGQMAHTFRIGNECSRVVYVYCLGVYLKPEDMPIIKSDIEAIAKSAGANEFHDYATNGEINLRIWWD